MDFVGAFKLDDTDKVLKPDTISTIYEHENEIFIASERTTADREGFLCLTRINLPDTETFTFTLAPASYGYVCAETVGGDFFGMSNGNEAVHLLNADQKQSLVVYTVSDASKNNVRLTKQKNVPITTSLKDKKGVREILVGTQAYTINYSPDTGINDLGANTLTVINTDYLNQEFFSGAGALDIVINRLNIQTSLTEVLFKLMAQPFLKINDKVLKNGIKTDIDVGIKDADEQEVTVKFTFTRFDDANAEVKLTQVTPNIVDIDPYSLNKIYFPYDLISYGNSVTMNVNFQSETPINKLTPVKSQYMTHKISIPENNINNRPAFSIDAGSAFLVNGDSNMVTYLKCDEENLYSTECIIKSSIPTHGIKFDSKHTSTSGVTITTGKKEITYDDPKKNKTFYYFNWFDHQRGVWDYEVYDQKIVDVGHTVTNDGTTYTVIAFDDKIQISKFFSGWTYGNRNVKTFDKTDVDVDTFCPVQVMFNANLRDELYVLSSCENTQNLILFDISDNSSPKFVESRWISSDPIPNEKKSCILPDELIIFDIPSSIAKEREVTLTSYDRTFSFTKSVIDNTAYGISKFYDFACVAELSVFITLNDNSSKSVVSGAKELIVFRGNSAMKGMRRILFRTQELLKPETIVTFQAYSHFDNVVVVLLDSNNNIVQSINISIDSPLLAVQADVDTPDEGKSLKMAITATNPKDKVDQLLVDLNILTSLPTVKPTLRGAKAKFGESLYNINDLLKWQNTPIVDCDLIADGKEVKDDQFIKATRDNSDSVISDLANKVGNYERFGSFDVVSYYKQDSSCTLEFGKIEIYEQNTEGISIKSNLFLVNTLRYTSSVSEGKYIYTAILTNEGISSSLKLTLAYEGKLSKNVVNIDGFTFLDKAHIFTTIPEQTNEDTKVELTVIGYSSIFQVLTSYKVTVTLKDDELLPKENNWSIEVKSGTDTTNPALKIVDYSFVNKPSKQNVNFYVVTEGSQQQVGRISYNMKTAAFYNDTPLKTLKFETSPKKDQQVYGIGCSSVSLEAEGGIDRCAFSTYGAVVYYVEMDNNDDPKSEQLGQSPTVKVNRMLRLRRINQNFGQRVSVLSNFVILETERILYSQTKAALVWDVTDYKDTITQDVAVNQVINLTLDEQSGGIEGAYDSIIINAVPSVNPL